MYYFLFGFFFPGSSDYAQFVCLERRLRITNSILRVDALHPLAVGHLDRKNEKKNAAK